MEINENMKNLFRQFCNAYGIKKIDVNDHLLVQCFFEWLKEERAVKDDFYRNLLGELGIDITDERMIEVGKTIHDSIVLPYNTRIVTPYGEGFEPYKNRVKVGKLKFFGNFPSIVEQQGKITHATPVDLVPKFITQNPYRGGTKNWEKFQLQDIVVGVYGDVNDLDRRNKMRLMNELFNRLDPKANPRKEYVVDDYNYAEIITTNHKAR